MRLLHSIRSIDPRMGGPIEGIRQLAAIHQREGRTVELVSLDAPDAEWVADFPCRVHALGPVATKYGFTPRLTDWLKHHAPAFDVVVVNGLWQFNALAVWQTLRRSPVPYYVFPHGMLDPWFKRRYPMKHLKKWLYWPWADYRVLRDARAVLFTSEQERVLARQSFGLNRCREVVLGYGTQSPPGRATEQRAAFLARFPECQDKRLWLFMARLHEKKGGDLLLRAFAACAAAHPSLQLVMAGPDQDGCQHRWEALSRQLGLTGRVTWTGMLGGDLKWGALHSAEVFILPSHQENFGIVVAEALACGVPVLISDQVNIWREIAGDGAGLVAPDHQVGAATLCARWLALSAVERDGMRERAQQCFAARFHIEGVARRLTEIWRRDGVGLAAPHPWSRDAGLTRTCPVKAA